MRSSDDRSIEKLLEKHYSHPEGYKEASSGTTMGSACPPGALVLVSIGSQSHRIINVGKDHLDHPFQLSTDHHYADYIMSQSVISDSQIIMASISSQIDISHHFLCPSWLRSAPWVFPPIWDMWIHITAIETLWKFNDIYKECMSQRTYHKSTSPFILRYLPWSRNIWSGISELQFCLRSSQPNSWEPLPAEEKETFSDDIVYPMWLKLLVQC